MITVFRTDKEEEGQRRQVFAFPFRLGEIAIYE